MTESGLPISRAAAPRSRTLAGLSTTQVSSSVRAFSATMRSIAARPTTGEVMCKPLTTPWSASTSASPILAQQIPTRAGLDLALGDIRALVRLGVRAQLQTSGPREIRHAGDVAGEGVEIDHQRRGVQAMPRSLLVQQMAVKLLVVHSAASSGREAPWAADGVSGPASLTRRVKNSRRLIRPLLTTWHAPANVPDRASGCEWRKPMLLCDLRKTASRRIRSVTRRRKGAVAPRPRQTC